MGQQYPNHIQIWSFYVSVITLTRSAYRRTRAIIICLPSFQYDVCVGIQFLRDGENRAGLLRTPLGYLLYLPDFRLQTQGFQRTWDFHACCKPPDKDISFQEPPLMQTHAWKLLTQLGRLYHDRSQCSLKSLTVLSKSAWATFEEFNSLLNALTEFFWGEPKPVSKTHLLTDLFLQTVL